MFFIKIICSEWYKKYVSVYKDYNFINNKQRTLVLSYRNDIIFTTEGVVIVIAI